MKKFAMFAALGLLCPTLAWAQTSTGEDPVDAELFKPAIGNGLFGVDSATILGDLKLHFGTYLNYARNSLVIFDKQDGEVFLTPVKDQSALDLMMAVGLNNRFEIGVAVPVGLYMSGDDLTPIGGSGIVQSGKLGDVRLNGKVSLFGNIEDAGLNGGHVAFNVEAKLPTGELSNQAGSTSFFGDKNPALAALLLGDVKSGKLTLMGNFGFRIRVGDLLEIENIKVGKELPFGAGLNFAVASKFNLLAEVDGYAQIDPGTFGSTPSEVRAGFKIGAGKFLIPIGAGVGLNNSFSSPDFRVFAGLSYSGQDLDPDEDRIVLPFDKCPQDPEDFDDFQDDDGCAELDNDNDGIADNEDKCPNDAEDKDEFEDTDGCPDLDNDKDEVADTNDKCPNKAEDFDKFQDEDGCEELDNDKDAINDKDDKCPNDAEDKDSFEDLDGCPDTDNDKDKIVDASDHCPDAAEDFDKFQDEDGCPDTDNDKDGLADGVDLCPNEAEDGKGKNPKDGCPDSTKAILVGGKVVILDKIFFDTNKDVIKPVSFSVLDSVAKVMFEHPELKKVRVEGNTDDVGDDAKNQILSEKRAKSVVKYLVGKGVSASRLEAKGNGESVELVLIVGLDLKSKDKAEKAKIEGVRDQNRRVEFFVVE